MTRHRPVIVGGGLAGGAAAVRLAQMGLSPLLLERSTEAHDKICGEFLSIEASQHLAALGLDVRHLGGTHIDTVRIRHGRQTASQSLPFVATGLTRRTLDAALLDHAAACGASVTRGLTVQRIADGELVTASGVIDEGPILLATGKHELHGAARDADGTLHDVVGFKQYLRMTPALARAYHGIVEIVIIDGGYVGVQRVDGDRLNVCLVMTKGRFKALGGRWASLWSALLREPALEALADAEPLLPRPLSIAGVPYGYLARPEADAAWYRLGDQAAVIPSFCGDGMAIALHSGRLAANAIVNGATAAAYQAQLYADVHRQVRLATRLQWIVATPIGPFALMAGLRAIPGALRMLAHWTRIAPTAVSRAL
ncbi:MAG: FAD-dependent monooxygenase [Gemmatimonadaceae bacterium]